jgi:actin related protein 2/3 complex subunit 5
MIRLTSGRYKGMAQPSPSNSTRNVTPQATGFTQVHTRGGGEGGGQAMSVLLSWHEKVWLHLTRPIQ